MAQAGFGTGGLRRVGSPRCVRQVEVNESDRD